MADVSLIRAGRWGLSRPVQDARGAWTSYAAEQRLGSVGVENYFPPKGSDGAPLCNALLVRLMGTVTSPSDGNTVLFPRNLADVGDVTLGELTTAQRNALRNTLESWLTGYTFTDWDGTIRIIPPFTERTVTYTADTTLKGVARDVYRHFAHSTDRPKPILTESHNTQHLDNFTTDPTSRWTHERGGGAWDSVDNEFDLDNGTDNVTRYSANNPGSIEHESQVTYLNNTSARDGGGPGLRMQSAVVDGYGFYPLDWGNQNQVNVMRFATGTRDILATLSSWTVANGDWLTLRMAAAGAAGSNVALSMWGANHGTTKPSDPGWIGADGTPDWTYSDTSASRLDDATHTDCGIILRTGGIGGDTRHSFFKERAISDRAGAADTTLAAALSGTASLAAALTTQIQMAAALNGSGVVAAALTTQIRMAAQLNGTAALLAALSTEIRMAAALNGSGALAGTLQTDIRLAAALQGLGSLTAALMTQIQMVSALSGSGSLAAALEVGDSAMFAVLAGTGQLAAQLSTQIALAAQLAGSGTVAAALTTAIDLRALLQGSGSLTADLLVAEIIAMLNRIAVTLHVGQDIPRGMHVAAQAHRDTTI